MISESVIELSRWQFAITALYHFLFVPLTLGLSLLLAIMESCYVKTGQPIYKEMTQFWGKLFGINFAVGVSTGLAMEFQFGMNWSYFSLYVGDIFGAPLAIESLVAFFLESTFVGLFFFGWDKLTKNQHLAVTWMLVLGSTLSSFNILIANGWLQNPHGAEFNYQTMRMEVLDFGSLLFNPDAWVKFAHTAAAAYNTAAAFVLAVSAYYLLNNRDTDFAKHSYEIAAKFGLVAVLLVIVMGDESGYSVGKIQKAKFAAIEAEWHTETPPAAFTPIAFPNQQTMENDFAVKIPWILGIIGTRSLDTPIIGLTDIVKENRQRIRNGIKAYSLLQELRDDKHDPQLLADFARYKPDLGYGLLLKAYTEKVTDASEQQIEQAAKSSIPQVAPLFWTFRIMVGCGFTLLLISGLTFFYTVIRKTSPMWLLKINLYAVPLPWIASEMGWFVSEFGRQPWAVADVLPTFLSVSSLSVTQMVISLIAYIALYSLFLGVEMFLMIRYIKQGVVYHIEETEVANG